MKGPGNVNGQVDVGGCGIKPSGGKTAGHEEKMKMKEDQGEKPKKKKKAQISLSEAEHSSKAGLLTPIRLYEQGHARLTKFRASVKCGKCDCNKKLEPYRTARNLLQIECPSCVRRFSGSRVQEILDEARDTHHDQRKAKPPRAPAAHIARDDSGIVRSELPKPKKSATKPAVLPVAIELAVPASPSMEISPPTYKQLDSICNSLQRLVRDQNPTIAAQRGEMLEYKSKIAGSVCKVGSATAREREGPRPHYGNHQYDW